jgi:hypothetical protein
VSIASKKFRSADGKDLLIQLFMYKRTIIRKRTMIRKNITIFYAQKNYQKNHDQEKNTIEDKTDV